MRLENYMDISESLDAITYEEYVSIMGNDLYEGVISDVKKVFKILKRDLTSIAKDMGVGMDVLKEAFMTNDVYNLLKAIGFNLKVLHNGFNKLTGLIKKGLFEVFAELHKTKLFQQLTKGAIKIDEILDKYPLLKKVGGVAMAALLIYIWLNMTFIGDVEYDFDMRDVVSALAGSYRIADLFLSPSGLMLIALFASGSVISAPWLGTSLRNIVFAIAYNGYTYVKRPDKSIIRKMMKKLKKMKLRT